MVCWEHLLLMCDMKFEEYNWMQVLLQCIWFCWTSLKDTAFTRLSCSDEDVRFIRTMASHEPHVWLLVTLRPWVSVSVVSCTTSACWHVTLKTYLHHVTFMTILSTSQLPPCGHLTITDTPIIWTIAKSPEKNKLQAFDWNKCPPLRTLTIKDNNSRSWGCRQ